MSNKLQNNHVLLVASGMSAHQVHDYPYKDNGWTIVAVNNGWQACPDLWDFWVRSNDFNGAVPTPLTHQRIVKTYGHSLREFGGQKECGYSITLNAAYWALALLKPKSLCFLGADMNYVLNEEGATHIYGLGNDIIKNGIPDPDRMAEKYGKGDPDYLINIYRRLETIAEDHRVPVYNLSQGVDTRLPYERKAPSEINNQE